MSDGSADGAHESDVPEAVRARRFEVVDERGQVRAVFGTRDEPPPIGPTAAIEIRNPAGDVRASVGVGEAESWILLTLAGNVRVHLGVNGPESDAVDTRAYLYLCDGDGVPVSGWRVTDDGSVETVDPPGASS